MILDAGSKLIYHYDKVNELLTTGKTYPVHITIGLTNYCNHKCTWCYIDFAKDIKHQINANIDRLIEVLSEAKEYGAKALTLVGDGEPTLHPQFDIFIKKANELGYDIGLFTNGSWKDQKITFAIAKYCRFIRFSMDCATGKNHKKTHLSSDFEHIVQNIKKIVKNKHKNLTVGVQFAFNQDNMDEIELAAKVYRELKVNYLAYKPVYKNELNLDHKENNIQSNIVKEKLKKAKEYETKDFKLYWKEWQIEALVEKNSNRGYEVCRAIWLSPYIDENGDVEFCGNLKGRGFTIGNIYKENFSEIWMSKKHFEKVDNIQLDKCPIGCKLHGLNLQLEKIVDPDPNSHVNFI